MMKGKELLCISLAAVCLAGTVSCSKDYTGRYIRIQGSTQPHAGATKTAYSDVTYTESAATYERIDWVSGDKILLAMKNDGGTEQLAYSITGIKSSSNRYSKATLVPDGVASGLQWGDGTHYFWSAYPSTATVGNDMTVRGSYPATQTLTYRTEADNVKYFDPDMNMAYMVASLSTPPQDYISLDYYPAMTTFDFEVGANDNIVITGFEMETETSGLTSDVDLTGTFVATFDPASGMAWTFTTEEGPLQTVCPAEGHYGRTDQVHPQHGRDEVPQPQTERQLDYLPGLHQGQHFRPADSGCRLAYHLQRTARRAVDCQQRHRNRRRISV